MKQLTLYPDGTEEKSHILEDLQDVKTYCKGVVGICDIAIRDIKQRPDKQSSIPTRALVQVLSAAVKALAFYSGKILHDQTGATPEEIDE